MKEWPQAVWIALSLCCTVTVMFLIINLCGVGRNIVSTYNEQSAYYDKLDDVHEYLIYDNTVCDASDIIALILDYHGKCPVVVNRNGHYYNWSDYRITDSYVIKDGVKYSCPVAERTDTHYTLTDISNVLSGTYNTYVIYGGNGEPLGIHAQKR